MKNYISRSNKSKAVQKIVNEALDILESVGIPLDGKSERSLERMAVSFLAVAGVTEDWKKAKGSEDNVRLKTREIIQIVNRNFEENIAPGSAAIAKCFTLAILPIKFCTLKTRN